MWAETFPRVADADELSFMMAAGDGPDIEIRLGRTNTGAPGFGQIEIQTLFVVERSAFENAYCVSREDCLSECSNLLVDNGVECIQPDSDCSGMFPNPGCSACYQFNCELDPSAIVFPSDRTGEVRCGLWSTDPSGFAMIRPCASSFSPFPNCLVL
jgi:hypothetical protein